MPSHNFINVEDGGSMFRRTVMSVTMLHGVETQRTVIWSVPNKWAREPAICCRHL